MIPFGTLFLSNYTDLWNKFDIDLNPLARVGHLLIRLGNVFGIWQFHSHLTSFSQEAVKARNGTGISPLPKLDPKHHQASVGVPAAHIQDEFDLLRGMLVWMAVRTVGTVGQGLERSVISFPPSVDILAVFVVADGCLCYPIFQRIFDYRLPEAHRLCYSIHSE